MRPDSKIDTQIGMLETHFSRPLDQVKKDLVLFVDLLTKWQKVQNLVSRETMVLVWQRHILDSLQLLSHMGSKCTLILDIGSGGGFPAIPLAIACKGSSRKFYLVESNLRKVSFLKTVSRELGLELNVHGKRIEHIKPSEIGEIDLITSRATASLQKLLQMVEPFWNENTQAVFHKGAEYRVELEECSANWHFDVLCLKSETTDSGKLLNISNLKKIVE